jgi:triosephosphate isomerase (TIM)
VSGLLFAANWKMHLGPAGAREYLRTFLSAYGGIPGRDVWFFPPAISLTVVAEAIRGRNDLAVGAQHLFWEPKGAFTGETSVAMAQEAGATAALVGHSERRHVFGETDAETGRKVAALLASGLTPLLCVGEQLAERDAGRTLQVIERQLGAVADLGAERLGRVIVAYEPVWAIGTGRNATPADAAEVHGAIRRWFAAHGVAPDVLRILYGGSVNLENVASLVAESEIDGVLVGGASLDAAKWARLVSVGVN